MLMNAKIKMVKGMIRKNFDKGALKKCPRCRDSASIKKGSERTYIFCINVLLE